MTIRSTIGWLFLLTVSPLLVACAKSPMGIGGTGGSGGAAGGSGGSGGSAGAAGGSVVEYHNNPARTGLYLAPNLTRAARATMHRDTGFTATSKGPTYAQPLFVDGGASGPDLLITATTRNQVSAFNAASGAVVWQRVLAAPMPRSQLPCGNIDPLGIISTPYVDV